MDVWGGPSVENNDNNTTESLVTTTAAAAASLSSSAIKTEEADQFYDAADNLHDKDNAEATTTTTSGERSAVQNLKPVLSWISKVFRGDSRS